MCAVVFALFLLPAFASAATLSVSPASQQTSVGKSVTYTVLLSSPDQSANAVEADITVSGSAKIVSLSKNGSLITLWAQEPSVTSSQNAHFSGVFFSGFNASGGTVIKVVVQGASIGEGSISLSNARVLANDGSGTTLPLTTRGGELSVTAAAAAPPVSPKASIKNNGTPKTGTSTSATATSTASTTDGTSLFDVSATADTSGNSAAGQGLRDYTSLQTGAFGALFGLLFGYLLTRFYDAHRRRQKRKK
jgi:hypothetical protein